MALGKECPHHHWAQSSPKCLFCRTEGVFLFSNLAKPLGTDRVRTLMWESFQHLAIVLVFGMPPCPVCSNAIGSPASQRPASSTFGKNGWHWILCSCPSCQSTWCRLCSVLRTDVSTFLRVTRGCSFRLSSEAIQMEYTSIVTQYWLPSFNKCKHHRHWATESFCHLSDFSAPLSLIPHNSHL